ncbi:Transcriptional regulator KdgR [Anaerohalosphaera lusitana]|uniref:Transcriptional regulator KdgR n=1 Tax=Anaerohalosphaera lusitana TaxID=1936003 RepID=A0A1U9NR49_9BACT|nr:IclR family transcriptional regulator [Anaerohalosphaera lusitana]AQT69996.1 Transcriptional regulator KdgR [Anaerohalosphaera lusitana]
MNNYIIPNLSKACRMLSCIAASDKGMTAAQIEQTLAVPKTTAFRILRTLCHEGMVTKNGGTYHVGPTLLELSGRAISSVNVRDQAVPVIQELAQTTGQTAHLAIPSGTSSLILEVCDSPNPVRVASRPGTLVSMHCSSTGKVFLAYLFKDRLAQTLADVKLEHRTANTKCTVADLQAETEKIRQLGYATDDEEYHTGVRCLAAPVFDGRNQVVAALGITATTSSFTPERTQELAALVVGAANKLSKKLGHNNNI